MGLANTVELLVNAVLVGRKQSPRGTTLFPKVTEVLKGFSQLVRLIQQHGKLVNTKKSTLRKRLAQIDRLKRGGNHSQLLRAVLKLLVIRNEGSHLGLKDFDREAIYALLEALIRATLIIWKAR